MGAELRFAALPLRPVDAQGLTRGEAGPLACALWPAGFTVVVYMHFCGRTGGRVPGPGI